MNGAGSNTLRFPAITFAAERDSDAVAVGFEMERRLIYGPNSGRSMSVPTPPELKPSWTMPGPDSRPLSSQLIAECVLAAIGGVCSLVLPPYVSPGGFSQPAYGWPLIPWFALAWANVHVRVSMVCFFGLGLAMALAQPRRWWLLGLAAMALPPVLLSLNIVHDWAHDGTSHNLFPFEFLMYGFICLPALAGAYLGFRARRWQQER